MADREPVTPHDLDAEAGVVGAIAVNPEQADSVRDLVRPEDFFRLVYAEIYASQLRLRDAGRPIDRVTVADDVQRNGGQTSDEVGLALEQATDGMPRSANARAYAEIVREHAQKRHILRLVERVRSEVYNAKSSASEVLYRTERALQAISDRQQGGEFISGEELVKRFFPVLEELAAGRQQARGVSTGFRRLDEMILGLRPGRLHIIGGRPGSGKSAFMQNMCTRIACGGSPVGLVSHEMSYEELFLRMLADLSSVNSQRLQAGRLYDDEHASLAHGLRRIADSSIWMDDVSTQTPSELRAKARRLVSRTGAKVLVVDYLQLMEGDDSSETRTLEISAISRALKQLAKELGIAVVALSQLNRAVDSRSDKRPVLSDLRESGSLEQDADVVLLLYREEYYKATPENTGVAELNVAKQRSGPTGTIRLRWEEQYTRFSDWED